MHQSSTTIQCQVVFYTLEYLFILSRATRRRTLQKFYTIKIIKKKMWQIKKKYECPTSYTYQQLYDGGKLNRKKFF